MRADDDLKVRIKVDVSNVDKELGRLGHGFNPEDLLRLETALVASYIRTQLAVHVITDKLRASGRLSSRLITKGTVWRGRITYHIRYARFEVRRPGVRRRPPFTSHNFMEPAEHVNTAYMRAMLAFLRGEE